MLAWSLYELTQNKGTMERTIDEGKSIFKSGRAAATEGKDQFEAARCAFSDRSSRCWMPLDPTHVRLKRTCV
jgi:hypothetical protein